MVSHEAQAAESTVYLDGRAWSRGPQLVYDRLAVRALAMLPSDLTGTTALDVGAGTGAATRELLRRGAEVVAADTAPAMLAELVRQTEGHVPTVLGDICDLPLDDDTYDVAVAAYVINHLEEPAVGVAELGRVTRPGGVVIATTFGADDHPIKPTVDAVLFRYGFVLPDWYIELKTHRMPLIATPQALHTVGERAGLVDAQVDSVDVDLSDLPWEAAVAYRLGLAHIASFLDGFEATPRAEIEADVLAAVRPLPPFRLPMLVLHGRAR
jgi:ubiquinone/menaquinone biosynthesis C-methylase UbiE